MEENALTWQPRDDTYLCKIPKFKEDDKKQIIVRDSLFDNETESADDLQKKPTAPLQPKLHCKQWTNAPLKEWLNYLNHCSFK